MNVISAICLHELKNKQYTRQLGVCKLLGQNSWVSSPYQNEEKSSKLIYVFPHLVFEVQTPRSPDLNPIEFYVWGHWNTLAYLATVKSVRYITNTFFCLPNHSQPPRDLLKGVTIHDQTCYSLHLLRWGTFWAFVVNCNLNNKNSIWTKSSRCVLILYIHFIIYIFQSTQLYNKSIG